MRVLFLSVVSLVVAGCGTDRTGGPGAVPALTTSPVTTSPVTTSPVTTSPVTTSPVTTSPVTTSPTTTSPLTTSPATEAPAGWDGRWLAVEGVVDGEQVAITGQIVLVVDGSTISGTAACNSYEYETVIEGDTIELADGYVTAMGCAEPLMVLEQSYLRSIGPIATLALAGGSLTLTTPRSVWTFVPVEAVADAPFAGTRWVASEIFGDFGVEHVVGMDTAFLVFGGDGTLTGSTGCRDLAGNWSDDGGRVHADATAEGRCSGVLVDVDATLLRVLADGFVPQIDGNHLVAASDGAGVGFFAG